MFRFARTRALLIFVGALIVAASYYLSFYFGPGSWDAWYVANVFHFTGGIWAFLFSRAVLRAFSHKTGIAAGRGGEIMLAIAGAVILGVVWEWYEFGVDRWLVLGLGRESYMTYPDTIGDLILDTAGAALAGLVAYWHGKRK